MDEDLHVWEISEPVTFDAQGNATVTAWCTEPGAIAAGAGTVKTINTPDVNWYSVTNEAEAALGDHTETDAALRKRRSARVALPSRCVISGMKAALLNISGVKSVNIIENNGDPNLSTNVVELNETPHAIMVIVDGGDSKEIAKAIFLKKVPGVRLVGDSQDTYSDDYGTENIIKFQRAAECPIIVSVTISTFAQHDESLVTNLIPQAVREYINTLGVGERLIVTMLNSVIFNANPSSSPVFSISNLSVTYGRSEYTRYTTTNITDLLKSYEMLRCAEHVTMSKTVVNQATNNINYELTIG